MIRVEVAFTEPPGQVPESAFAGAKAASEVNHLRQSLRDMSHSFPSFQLWEVVTNYGNGRFKIRQGRVTKDWVRALDHRAKLYLHAGSVVVVGFENRNPDRPYIRGIYGVGRLARQYLAYSRAYWPQAEGQPELSNSTFTASPPVTMTSRAAYLAINTAAPPNGSYLARGYVVWTEPALDVAVFAFAHWVEQPDGWWLAVMLSNLFTVGDSLLLEKYDIADNGGAIAQSGGLFGGGLDHGCLALHYRQADNSLVLFGPLTHLTGKRTVYHVKLSTLTVKRSVVSKALIHASLGHDRILSGHWGSSASASGAESDYYLGDQSIALSEIGETGAVSLVSSIPVSSLVAGNYLFGCTPNGRARGRWPWRTSDNAFFVFAAACNKSAKTIGGTYPEGVHLQETDTGDGVADPPGGALTNYTSISSASLCAIAPTGLVTQIVSDSIAAESATINMDSLDWYDSLVTPTPQGWALTEGIVPTRQSTPVYISWGPLLYTIPEQVLLHPLTSSNPHPLGTSTPNDVFEWAPAGTTGPGMSVSDGGKLVQIRSVPFAEIYYSNEVSPGITFETNEYYAWRILDLHPGDPGYLPIPDPATLTFYWQIPARRCYYKTYLSVFSAENLALVSDRDISQYLEGMQDGPVTTLDPGSGLPVDNYRDYEARPILDQIWQYQMIEAQGIWAGQLDMIPILRGWRDQLTGQPSEARPVLNLHDPSGLLLNTIELMPTDWHPVGGSGPRYANMISQRPQFKWGISDATSEWPGTPWIDIYTHYRARDTADASDDVGDDPTTLRITSIRWTIDHQFLEDAVIAYEEFVNADDSSQPFIPEQSLDGLIYAAGTPLWQLAWQGIQFS